MPPKFHAESFTFKEDRIPVLPHIDTMPNRPPADHPYFWLEGEDTFSYEFYPLATDIEDLPTAEILREARLRKLEETQPSVSSGGQGGIQDKVHIRYPAGYEEDEPETPGSDTPFRIQY